MRGIILAADESPGTIQRRLEGVGVRYSYMAQRLYRWRLFGALLASRVSGVIVHKDTLADGAMMQLLVHQGRSGINVIVKADEGLADMPLGQLGEKVSQGLDSLTRLLDNAKRLGASAAKWRVTFRLGSVTPTVANIEANASTLAAFAAACQAAGIVPIIEPEVLLDGDYSLARCREDTMAILHRVFDALTLRGVHLPGVILKASIVSPGSGNLHTMASEHLAIETLDVFRRAVPATVGGIVLLSGGHSMRVATEVLHWMQVHGRRAPWPISCSYGRALQEPALAVYGADGSEEDVQAALEWRVRACSAARKGRWTPAMERVPRRLSKFFKTGKAA